MAAPNTNEAALKKLQDYVEAVNSTEYSLDSSEGAHAYENGLERTLKELTELVNQEQTKLERLQKDVEKPLWQEVDPDLAVRLQQLQVITAAFRALSETEPTLPRPESHLPALLAARETERLVRETKESAPLTYSALKAARQDLTQEQTDFTNAQLLTKALEKRIDSLRQNVSERAQRSPEETAQILLDEKEQAQLLKRSHKKLTNALARFVDSSLAPLVAAEELGGPVVGSTLDISEDVLAAGFTLKGRPNKSKKKTSQDARQQRIDKMFASAAAEEDGDISESETRQAALAVKDLLGELLQAAIDHGSSRYLTIEKETAASRFLVRAKVATLDPRDARKIRLIDFAKTLDD